MTTAIDVFSFHNVPYFLLQDDRAKMSKPSVSVTISGVSVAMVFVTACHTCKLDGEVLYRPHEASMAISRLGGYVTWWLSKFYSYGLVTVFL